MDSARQPTPGASVYVVSAPRSLPDVALLTDEAGRFVLTAPFPGDYVIGARLNSSADAKQLRVNVEQETIDIEFVL
jgi:hypothetical protein